MVSSQSWGYRAECRDLRQELTHSNRCLENLIEQINSFDGALIRWVQGSGANPWVDGFFFHFTDLHKNPWFMLGGVVPLLALWWIKRGRRGFFQLLTVVVTLSVVDGFCGQVVKKLVARPRPFDLFADIMKKSEASGFSFVSNHAANMVGLAVLLSSFFPRWRYLWWTLASLVGFSRVYNGVHFLSDVLVGALIGGGVASWVVHRLPVNVLKKEDSV